MREVKDLRSQQTLEAQRSARDAELAAKAARYAGTGLTLVSGGVERTLDVPSAIQLFDGAFVQLAAVDEWGVPAPQIAGQAAMWEAARGEMSTLKTMYTRALEEALTASREVCMCMAGACHGITRGAYVHVAKPLYMA